VYLGGQNNTVLQKKKILQVEKAIGMRKKNRGK
jgi:hypothetical protein